MSISEKRMRSSKPDEVPMPETIMSSTIFWALMASFLRLVSSRRSSEDEMCFVAKDSRNWCEMCISTEAFLLAPKDWASIVCITYDLQLVLPEFLLARLVEKGEIADMVDKDVSQNR
ncbi:hypothetical protein NLG97_g10127 [Lecanicillium saksenae]|uniref:Uncharacterized protein n=1 Tax=Lecanicillium saksenae TaxID=468837 RepID=A0ACC1QE32_9HYPO|nr:hypothetical protein NLG97_g10127 [Lecanicillium saksenae]